MRVTFGDFPGVDFVSVSGIIKMHEISISGDFSEVDFVSVSDIISACDFNDKDFH